MQVPTAVVIAIAITSTIMVGYAHSNERAGALGQEQGIDTAPDLSGYFAGLNGTFVLLDAASERYVRYHADRANERFAPCSTFKIPNTAILIESETARDPAHTLAYDSSFNQPAHWARNFDLQSAFKASAMWYYRQMALMLGLESSQRFLEQFGYGNADASGGLQGPFWVDGSLRISPNEQVEFLRAFYEERLGLSERTTRLTKEIMLAEETQRWRLSAKTGACQPNGEETSNWYVGYVEKNKNVYYFAIQLGAPEYGRAYDERIPITRRILKDLGILD
ncbi:penicillin-binding transpeptidase domain-containing protein [Trichlorobacter ammonificans]|uniref:Beta-lactamase n=1 Tax=Trichlorobacter ammonificans TaxID=2916410 RepID=A0ABM9D6L8_9BACT|nr:penicillin-binding transpeptidase domain-containing protein [Trichlorobacter ammonificans]CAH2030622.1 Beta-lactamase [Trichlorobacter ammonificans]